MMPLSGATSACPESSARSSNRQLTQQGHAGRGTGQDTALDHDGGRGPEHCVQYVERIASQSAAETSVDIKADSTPRPLGRPEEFARHQPVQAEHGEKWRSVDEHRHVRGGYVIQAD